MKETMKQKYNVGYGERRKIIHTIAYIQYRNKIMNNFNKITVIKIILNLVVEEWVLLSHLQGQQLVPQLPLVLQKYP